MTGRYDEFGYWQEDQQGNNLPVEVTQTALSTQALETSPLNPQPTEPTIEEHASMIRKGFDSILNKALESTELARRVAELERQVQMLKETNEALQNQWVEEATKHGETAKVLQQVQAILAQREGTVHDLVIERDIVIEERNAAQNDRDNAINEAKTEEGNARMWERKAIDLDHAVQVATERAEQMARQVATIKQAFQGLMSL